MSCTTNFHFITYNCHLFPNPDNIEKWNIGNLYFMDPQREEAIHKYLEAIQPYSSDNQVIQVAALQEVWGRGYANDIISHVAKHGSYGNAYAIGYDECLMYVQGAPLGVPPQKREIYIPIFCGVANPSGLVLLADPACRHFRDTKAYDYMSHCGDNWSGQDMYVAKGFLRAKLDYFCAKGDQHSLLLFTTHMPTSYGTYPTSLECCYDYLASEVQKFRTNGDHQQFATVVLGDFNIDYFKTKANLNVNGVEMTEYQDGFKDRLLSGTGLVDATAAFGVEINPFENTLWTHFNPNEQPTSPPTPSREDYILYANSADGSSMSIDVQSVDAITTTTGLIVQDSNGDTYNCSDHFPLEANIAVTVNDG